VIDRDACIELIEDRYFGGVMRADLAGVRDCFTNDARVVIRHGDLPPRQFAVAPAVDESNLLAFYEHICGNYECWFGEFRHYVDVEQQRAASTFKVRLTPRPEGAFSAWPIQELVNCNFFDFDDGRIAKMIIYYSNPGATRTGEPNPTGYPPRRM